MSISGPLIDFKDAQVHRLPTLLNNDTTAKESELQTEITTKYSDLIGTVFDSWKDIKRLPKKDILKNIAYYGQNSFYFYNFFLQPIMRGRSSKGEIFITFRYNIRDLNGNVEAVAVSILFKKSTRKKWKSRFICIPKMDFPLNAKQIVSLQQFKDPISLNKPFNIKDRDTISRIKRLIKREPIGQSIKKPKDFAPYQWFEDDLFCFDPILMENPNNVTKYGRAVVELVDALNKSE